MPNSVKNNRLVAHGSDVPYIFGTLSEDAPYDEVDQQISREMQHAFVEFARTGVPRSVQGTAWPAFTVKNPKYVVVRDQVAFDTYRPEPLLAALTNAG